MLQPETHSYNRAFTTFYTLCVAVFLALTAYHSVQLILYPLPLSYIEPSILTVTDYIASGHNPYSLEAQPARTSVYPVLYNIIAAPLTDIFGNTLPMHRALSALCLLLCCLLFYRVTYQACRSHADTLATTTLLYCGFMVYSTPVASPNGIGLLLFFTALYVPAIDNYSTRSLIVSVVAGVLAFHAKQYFVAALGFMALYIFLADSKSRGVYFGMAALLTFLTSLALILPGSPYYLDALVFAVSNASDLAASNAYMWEQCKEYSIIAGPVIAVTALGLALAAGRNTPDSHLSLLNIKNWRAPLFPRGASLPWVLLACSSLIFIVSIGRNPGNHLTYLFQIVSPFLLTLAAVSIARGRRIRWAMRAIILLAFYTHYNLLSHDFSVEDEENWATLESIVATGDSIYATSIVLEQILQQGGEVYNNGHTPYFQVAKNKPALLVRRDYEKTTDALWQAWTTDIHDRLANQHFDLVVIDPWTPVPDLITADGTRITGAAALKSSYRKRMTLSISLANRPGGGKYAVSIWEPRPKRRHKVMPAVTKQLF